MKVTRIEEVIVKQILLASIIANVKRIVRRISILTFSPWKVCFYFNPCSSSLTLHPVCIISNNSSLFSGSPFHNPFPNLNPNPHPLLPSLDCLLLSPERGGERCRTGAEYCCSGYKARRCIQVWFLYIVLKISCSRRFCQWWSASLQRHHESDSLKAPRHQHHISPPIIRGKVTRIKKLILNKKLSRSSTNSHNSEKKMYGKQWGQFRSHVWGMKDYYSRKWNGFKLDDTGLASLHPYFLSI